MKATRWWWLDARRRLVRRIVEPAIICDAAGTVVALNAAAERLAGAPAQLPRDWGRQPRPFIGHRPTLRFPLHGGDTLFLAEPEGDAPTERLYRSMRDTLYRVISTIAHDLRSPLASLVFNIKVLQSRWQTLPPAEVDRTLEAMSRACELEMKAVAELVEQVNSDEGRACELATVFDRIDELLSPLFRDQDNVLRLDLPRGLQVAAAPMVLEQIFVNLIRNAVESDHGPVTVLVEGRRHGAEIVVRVQNDGPPIPAAQRARIFTPFFSTKPTGTGMGLVFAREAARDLGGDLRIVAGEATVFEVVLPLDDPPAAQRRKGASSGAPGSTGGGPR